MKRRDKIIKEEEVKKTSRMSELTWGIGIEHEMRVRFKKGYYQFSKDFTSRFFPPPMEMTIKNSSGYIFIQSYILMYYFDLLNVFLLKRFFEFTENDEEKKYANDILILYDLYLRAKSKKEFPLDNPLYFIRSNKHKDFIKNRNHIQFYLKMYNLYHNPMLFFDIHFSHNSSLNITFESIWDLNYQLANIEDDEVFQMLITSFTDYYHGDIYRSFRDKLSNILESKNIQDITVEMINSEDSDHWKISSIKQFIKIDIHDFSINNMGLNKKTIKDLKDIQNRYIYIIKNTIEHNYQFDNSNLNDIYHYLYFMYKNSIPMNDNSSRTQILEFITVNYRKKSFESMYEELMNIENTFFKVINQIPIFKKYVEIFGEIGYHQIGSVGESIEVADIVTFDYNIVESDYTGSYHIWVTPPYRPTTSSKRFQEECATLANKFQLIEPLIAAHFTSPSIEAFGDDGTLARSSFRQFIGAYSNYGTADISFLMGAPSHTISKYYLSENDLKQSLEEGKQLAIFAYVTTPVYSIDGKQIMNLDKLEERFLTSNLYRSFKEGNINSKPPPNIEDYYSRVFTHSKIRPVDNHLNIGPDIRTRDYKELVYPLSNDWTPEFIKKDNKFIQVYVNYKDKKISYVPVFNKEKHKKRLKDERIGIEMRVFDHFPTHYLYQILQILSCITFQSFLEPYTVTKENMYIHQQWWHNEMANVIMQGFEYKPSYTYLKNLAHEFKLSELRLDKIESKKERRISSKTYTQMVFEKIFNRLHKRFKPYPLYQKLSFQKPNMKFISLNKKAWYNIFTDYLIRNPTVYRELSNKKELNDQDIVKVLGNKYQQNVKRVKSYIHNIHKVNMNNINKNKK
jgi:hypothetical protein